MFRKLGLAFFSVGVLASVFTFQFAYAQAVDTGRYTRPLVTQNIDEGKLVTLKGNTRPEANPKNDRGTVADHFPLEHMLLQLQRPPELEKALVQFIDELHNPDSPNFHKVRFGAARPGYHHALAPVLRLDRQRGLS